MHAETALPSDVEASTEEGRERARAAIAELDDVAHQPGAAKPDPILVADKITRTFGGLTAVDVEHIEVQRGVITALIGPNGAGKTTFFNLLTGFDSPDTGTWSFEGKSLNAPNDIAAHPDDENTRLISYFANDVKARTAYLSMTRGDGGQNLIGSELGELLGVIRTDTGCKVCNYINAELFSCTTTICGRTKNFKICFWARLS